ncbi:terminase small subunit, partial [Pectobacterium odoriferum]
MAKPDMESIKRDYCAGELSIQKVADRHGIAKSTLIDMAKKSKWVRQKKPTKKPDQTNQKPRPKKTVGRSDGRTDLQPSKSIPQIENQIDSNCPSIESVGDDWTLNPDEYGLNDMQARFVNEYLRDLNRVAAYKRAGYKCEGQQAYAAASILYRNLKVSRAIRDALDARERRTQITQDDVLKMWWEIATADANQITELRRLCCRHCWGFGFQYQWQDAVEFEEARLKAVEIKKREPLDNGGYGFDAQLDPNPECPRCNGMGVSRSYFHDTRDLRGAAR